MRLNNAIGLFWSQIGPGIDLVFCAEEEADHRLKDALSRRQDARIWKTLHADTGAERIYQRPHVRLEVECQRRELARRRAFLEPLVDAGLTRPQIEHAWEAHTRKFLNRLVSSGALGFPFKP